MRASLQYCSIILALINLLQARIIEFKKQQEHLLNPFQIQIPFSETFGFIADVDDTDEGGNDFAFVVSAHEIAHQWWAHQVIGADVLGSTMLSESLSEYVALKVIEGVNGKK